MSSQNPASPRSTFLCGPLAIGMGLFLLLFGLGVVPMKPRAGAIAVRGTRMLFSGKST